MERARQQYGMTERHACRLLEQRRGTQRYAPIQRNDVAAVGSFSKEIQFPGSALADRGTEIC
jgi:hypothetical protein